ncbi:WD40 repeat-like protein [Sporormia fimetaria CBS 119925]|uniref:Pre-rRNA-processing protein IPI3 n=1 Tax=Sporormia fimetaria CBS 119925 TaxID=1340428 RepID=A0A6A6VSN9_9PLEO|nr:WD40 repeat-like protein [Sporormia fimetaria CBS 119925]
MLTEHFVASIAAPTKPNTGVTKDAGVFLHEFQPLAAQRHVFKKSAAASNGLAVSSSHIFTAQDGKAVVHVYSREKGNQEAIVPFPERVHSIALACDDTVLLVGGESGRVMVWELCSGRLVSTSTSHLQPVTALVVDPTSNFFLSGSSDSMIHVWNLASILSFSPDSPRSPIHTLSTHRVPITGLACGHSSTTANIAVSVSEDKSAMVWDYHSGQLLRTYLLPEAATAVTLDPADRAFYVAYADGSLQTLSFYDEMQQSTPVDILRDGSQSHRPVQPPPTTRFNAESQKLGGVLSLSLSWDGTTLLSGHDSGKIASWDLAKNNFMATLTSLPGPVTNLQFLTPTGFPNAPAPKFRIHTVTKPRQDLSMPMSGNALVPPNYTWNVEFTGRISVPRISAIDEPEVRKSDFEEALTHASFPMSMLEESLAELESWGSKPTPTTTVAPAADFLSLSESTTAGKATAAPSSASASASDDVKALKKQLATLQRIQKATFSQLSSLREENTYLLNKERERARQVQKRGLSNGRGDADVDMDDAVTSSESDASSEEDEDTGSGDDGNRTD